jgi:hypothetical protein
VVSSGGKLSRIQRRVLEALTGIEPPFVLSGGAALAGVHLGHRARQRISDAEIVVDSPCAILAESSAPYSNAPSGAILPTSTHSSAAERISRLPPRMHRHGIATSAPSRCPLT